MKISVSPLENGINLLSLEGFMDIAGTDEIDLKLTALTSTERQYIVTDLSKVHIMASIGIGTLVRCAKAVRLRGGNMVLLNPQPQVRSILEKMMIDRVVPIFSDLEQSCKMVKEPYSGLQ